jgi:hypothetical protein
MQPHDAPAEVHVFRGKVQVRGDSSEKTLRALEAARFVDTVTRSLRATESESLRATMDRFEVLETRDYTALDVQTTGGSATLWLDGKLIGETPVRARLKPGIYDLTVRVGDRIVVREELTAVNDERIERIYRIDPIAGDEPSAPPEPPPEKPAKRQHEPKEKNDVGAEVEALLADAQALRAKQDWRGVEKAYQRLVHAYGKELAGRTAMVSLGQLYLTTLARPKMALHWCGLYAARHHDGVVLQEALLCTADAQLALGKREASRRTLESFLVRFPDSVQAESARRKLDVLTTKP